MSLQFLKKEIDEFLESYFQNKGSYNKLIYESMSYSLNVGGKRIRPILSLLTYKLYKEDYKKIISMAAAIEMIHTYSLVHDDLPCMDNDDLRRGKPTNHKKYSEAIAVLTGDGLLNEAFNLMLCCNIEESLKLEAMKVISEASSVEGMIGGQVVDILSEHRKIEKEELYYMHRKKTGALIKASVLVGAILGGASKEDFEILSIYGEKLGLVFQIIDDILDVEGNKEKLGKNIHMDSARNKTNFITIYGMDKCKFLAKELTEECFCILNKLDRDTKYLMELTRFLLKREF